MVIDALKSQYYNYHYQISLIISIHTVLLYYTLLLLFKQILYYKYKFHVIYKILFTLVNIDQDLITSEQLFDGK